MKTCANCGKVSQSDVWEKGEVCLFGMIFFCSKKCALEWVKKEEIEPFDEKRDLSETEE
jgi:hypothetical protein